MAAFKASPQGKALKKEMIDLKMAIKTHLKVTDVPKMDDSDDEESDIEEELDELLKISITPAGQKAVEKEGADVHNTAHKIAKAPATQ